MGKVLLKKEYIRYLPKEETEMGEDHLDPQTSQTHPIRETTTLTTRVTIEPQTGQVMMVGDQHLVRIKHQIKQKQKGSLKY